MKYSLTYRILAGQVDITEHLSNVQYYEFFKSTIFSFLHQHQFSELNKPKDLWPVVFNESCEFHKEILFDEQITVEIFFSDLGAKKNKWLCTGVMYNEQGVKAATWKSYHGIMNRENRRIEPLSDAAVDFILKYYDELVD